MIAEQDISNQTDQKPIDLLNRDQMVSNMLQLINAVSDNRSSCTFALNGAWGSGKSFVLDMLENQLYDYQAGSKYIVFRYNCWKYDYYEEPLIAIVSAMLDDTDRESHLFSKEIRENAKAVFQTVKPVLENISAGISLSFGNINPFIPVLAALEIQKGVKENLKANKYNGTPDSYLKFNEELCKARKELEKLAQDKSIVVIVDELDRCLPDYAIKVLERLHHLFYKL